MYEKELSVAIKAAKSAGEVIMKYFKDEKLEVKLKKDRTLVTKADIESNKLIVGELKKNFPLDGIISEELQEIKGKRKWYVDPLDGTESFVRGTDEFVIQIGLCENEVPILGVVFRVAKGDIYYSIKGRGAFKDNNNGKVSLRILPNLSSEMTCVISHGENEFKKIERFLDSLSIKNIVRSASTGLRILKIIDGEADIYILSSPKVNLWDICAPHAILQESGGQISYADGSEVLYQHNAQNEKIIIFTRTNEQLSNSIKKIKLLYNN